MGAFPALPSGFFKICRFGSEQSALPETVVAQAPGIGLQPAEDDVIVQLDVDRLRGLAQLSRDFASRRCWVRHNAAWMVVHAMTAVAPWRMASRNTSRGWARLLVAVPELTSTCLSSRFFRLRHRTQNFSISSPASNEVKWARTEAGFSKAQSAGTCCSSTRRATSMTATSCRALTRPMPLCRRKSSCVQADQARQRPRFGDQPLCDREDVVASAAAAQQHGQQFRVAQGGRPVFLKAFLRAFADREVFEPHWLVGVVAHGLVGFSRRPASVEG